MITRCKLLSTVATLFLAGWAVAGPPLQALPAPDYSFDLQSPKVQSGLLRAGAVLKLAHPVPQPLIPAPALGLFSVEDDLDGLSAGHESGLPTVSYALLFSVDRASVGAVPPDPNLVCAGVPYNVFDQARKGQAAGDQFMSLEVFGQTVDAGAATGRTQNNVLVRNNYNEGGTDFSADPPAGAHTNLEVMQDNVDGFTQLRRVAHDGPVRDVYFSVTRASPSLPSLSGSVPPSGASVFYNPDPLSQTPTEFYATWQQLGLQQADDIDAVIVVDKPPRFWSPGDLVLFSLDPNSPSLRTIPGASGEGAAADIFVTVAGGQGPLVFRNAAVFGLGHPRDNIDALDLVICPSGYACALQYGIRIIYGDLNCDYKVSFDDINPFVLALTGELEYAAVYPHCEWRQADCNCDGRVDFEDINPFVKLLTTP